MKQNQICNTPQVAEIKLSYSTKVKASDRPKIESSKDAYKILNASWDKDQIEFIEQFKILLLNRANRVLGIFTVSTGGVAGTVADPKVIFAAAIRSNASALILAHNHPSGNLMSSSADVELTRRLRDGGKLLEVQILDHLILTVENYLSMADEGII